MNVPTANPFPLLTNASLDSSSQSDTCERCGGVMQVVRLPFQAFRMCRACIAQGKEALKKAEADRKAQELRAHPPHLRCGVPERYRSCSLEGDAIRDARREGPPPILERQPGVFFACTSAHVDILSRLRAFRPRTGRDTRWPWLVLSGPTGVGKSHLAAGYLLDRYRRGDGGGLWLAESSLGMGLGAQYGSEERLQAETLLRRAETATFLVWDDFLGKLHPQQTVSLLETRYNAGAMTLFTTQRTRAWLETAFPDGGSSFGRLVELTQAHPEGQWLELVGQDMRRAP